MPLAGFTQAQGDNRYVRGRSRLHVFGHSYAEGLTGCSKIPNRFGNILAALLDATEHNLSKHGAATVYAGTLSQVILAGPPTVSGGLYQGLFTDAAAIFTGINDLPTGSYALTDNDIVPASLRAAIHYLRAQRVYSGQSSANFPLAQASGAAAPLQQSLSNAYPWGSYWKLVAANTWTVNTPADFPGGTLRVWGMTQPNVGATHTITVNGTAYATVVNPAGLAATPKPWRIEITGLPAGANAVVGTLSAVGSAGEWVTHWEYAAATPPPVAVANIPRLPAYTASGYTSVNDTIINTVNALLPPMVAEFTDGRVLLLDADTLLGKTATYFASDSLHPNDLGHRLIANAFAALLRPKLLDASTAAQVSNRPTPEALLRLRMPQTTPSVTQASPAGLATLAAGTVTVTTRAFENANDIIVLTRQSGSSTGQLSITAKTATTGSTSGTFTITSSDAADTSVVGWFIVNSVT